MKGSVDRYNNSEERKVPHTHLCVLLLFETGVSHTHTHTHTNKRYGLSRE